jgi:F-type H+-transporting ATPase subunit b
VNLLAVADGFLRNAAVFAAEEGGGSSGLTINLFWIVVAAGNFLVFFAIAWKLALKPVAKQLRERRDRIEQGLIDADSARRDREAAADQRQAILGEARREANEIIVRAQRSADDARAQGVADTRADIDRLREQAVAEIDAERVRALAEVRGQVADLALQAAGKVVGETMTGDRERRLVDEFLAQATVPGPSSASRN